MLKDYFANRTNRNKRNNHVMRGTIVLPLFLQAAGSLTDCAY